MWRVEMPGGVWSGECGVWGGECGVESVGGGLENRVENVEWRMWSAREMEDAECGDA